MPFDPERAELRFGCGLAPNLAPPASVGDMMARLTGPDIAADLLDVGAPPSLPALVLERLTHDDEATTRMTLGELGTYGGGSEADDTPFSDLSVLVVRAE